MTIGDFLNPNKEISSTSRVWYVLALASLVTALYIAFSAGWQHRGIYVPGEGCYDKVADANMISLVPKMSTMMIAVLLYGSLLARRCVRGVSNILTLLLVIGNILLVGTLIESILPAQEVALLSFFGYKLFTVTPQKFLVFVALFSWIGMRAIAGFGIIFLIVAFLSRMTDMNVSLGLYGSLYVLFSFVTLILQMKLPYMMPEGGFLAVLRQDFGIIASESRANLCAAADVAKKTAAVAMDAAVAMAAPASLAGSALATKGLEREQKMEEAK